MSAIRYISLATLCVSIFATAAAAQQPTPASPRSYGALQAADDSYRNNEAERRAAIDQQIGQQNAIRAYRTWKPYAEAYALPYVYYYGGPVAGMYTHRALERYVPNIGGYVPELRGPRDFFYQPQFNEARQPIGHEKIWTGPNSYIYKPKYAEAVPPPTNGPILAAPDNTPALPAPPQPQGRPARPASRVDERSLPPPPVASPGVAQPEIIPPPPPDDGPVEF